MPIPWSEIDWKAERPSWDEIQASHRRLGFDAFDLDAQPAGVLLGELETTHVNGGGLLKGFRLAADDDVLHWFASRNRFVEYDFFQVFLGSTAVRDALPELKVPEPLGRELGFEESWSGTLTLDGELAASLVQGGAYEKFTRTRPGSR